MMNYRRILGLLPVAAGIGVVLCSGWAESGTNTAIPCPAKAKAVIANTGQSMHNAASLVQGDVQAATSIIQNSGSTIIGTKTPNTPAGLAVVPPPATATNLGTFLLNSGQTATLTAGNYVASSFTLNGNSTLNVTGGIVQVWVTGALVLGGKANNGGTPENLEFLVTGTQDAHVNGGSTLFGFIYAPRAPVLVDAPVHGSVVGSGVTVNSGGQVLFDPGSACPTCQDTQSDPNNCGTCGHVCPAGNSCELGVCVPPGSCLPAGSIGLLISGTSVDAYVPLGDWLSGTTGIRRIPVEGANPRVTIATPNVVNSCASNSVTGKTVCTANNTDVYIINGTAVGPTLTSGATGSQSFSGGSCQTCGVAIDPVGNRAAVAIGLSTGGAFQFLDLATNTLAAPIPAGAGVATTEDILIDPGRNLLLSPNEANNYQILNTSSSTIFNFQQTHAGEMDSAAEDCGTGIALSSVEGTTQLFLANLGAAVFTSPTWTAPSQFQNFPEFAPLFAGTNGIAIAPGTHLGVVTGEFGGSAIGVIQLPTSAGAGTPSVVDYVEASLPPPVAGGPAFSMGRDPHTVTAYKSPSSGKALAVLADGNGVPRTFLAVVDMQALLAAPRVAGTHNAVTPLSPGIVTYIAF